MNIQPLKRFDLDIFLDDRGILSVCEPLPFTPKRFFFITEVPHGATRGSHAHRECHQVIVSCTGAFFLGINNIYEYGKAIKSGSAIWIPPMNWVKLQSFTRNAVCLVLCSEHYDPDEVIDDYDQFINELKQG